MKTIKKTVTLKPYQLEGIKFLNKPSTKRKLLADEMGLGKTIQAIATIKPNEKTLIIAPPFLLENWKREIQKFHSHEFNIQFYPKLGDITLIGASQKLVNAYKTNLNSNFDRIIIDECHYFKSWKSQRTKTLIKLVSDLPESNFIFLTGTPLSKSIIDFHPILCMLQPNEWGTLRQFGFRYAEKRKNPFSPLGFDFVGVNLKALDELKKRLEPNFLRRLKKDHLKELGPKQTQKIHLKTDPKLAAQSLAYASEIRKTILDQDAPDPSDSIATICRELGESKIKQSAEYLSSLIDQSEKPILVFAKHKTVTNGIHELLSKKYKTGCITGSTTTSEKQKHVDSFQNLKLDALIGNITAMGTGLTLTAANTVVFVELDWSPANMLQAIDRVHRIGQSDTVLIQYILVADSVEDNILTTLREKTAVIKETVGVSL